MPRRRMLLVVIGLLVVAALAGGVLLTTGILIDDTANYFPDKGFRYIGWYENPDYGRVGSEGKGEVFDSARYVASINAGAESEKVLAKYGWCKAFLSSAWYITDSQVVEDPYRGFAFLARYIKNGAVSHELKLPVTVVTSGFKISNCPGTAGGFDEGFVLIPFDTVEIGTDTGSYKIELWQYMVDNVPFGGRGWFKVAEDGAALVPGSGSCVITNVQTIGGYERPFKPGEEVRVNCKIGYASSAKLEGGGSGTWALWIGATRVADLGPGPAPGGVDAVFPAPSSAGKYEIVLVNSLFPIYTYHFTVTVNPDLAPPPPKVTFDIGGPWLTGQTITVSWQADPNPDTKTPIQNVFYEIEYIDGQVIKQGSSGGATGSISFNTGGRNVDIRTVVWSQDASGELSMPTQPVSAVEGCDLYVSCKTGNFHEGSGGFAIPLWVVMLIIGIIAIVLAVVLPFPIWPWKILMILLGIILVLVGIVLQGFGV